MSEERHRHTSRLATPACRLSTSIGVNHIKLRDGASNCQVFSIIPSPTKIR